jgi:hypothetical protein
MTEPTDFNGKIIAEFRASAGKAGGPFAGADILLLHHTGACSGIERIKKAAPRKIPVILLDPV